MPSNHCVCGVCVAQTKALLYRFGIDAFAASLLHLHVCIVLAVHKLLTITALPLAMKSSIVLLQATSYRSVVVQVTVK